MGGVFYAQILCFIIESDYFLWYNDNVMKDEEVKDERVLSEEQKKLVIDNIGLLRGFYRDEISKGYIPGNRIDDFKSDLQRNFCKSALTYNEDLGFKFSTYAYGGFGFCVKDIKRIIARNKKTITTSNFKDFILEANDGKFYVTRRRLVWDSINGHSKTFVDAEKIAELLEKASLSDREKKVINLYYLERWTQEKLGKELGICKERIRQIISEAITKIKVFVDSEDYEIEDFVEYK